MNKELEVIANQLATVKGWCVIPEETEGGINGVLDSLNELIDARKTISISQLKMIGQNLLSDGDNVEYDRAICELVADVDGIEDVDHCERALQIAKEFGIDSEGFYK